eukprot:2892945-Pleurochrysis_carterae.AAC.3
MNETIISHLVRCVPLDQLEGSTQWFWHLDSRRECAAAQREYGGGVCCYGWVDLFMIPKSAQHAFAQAARTFRAVVAEARARARSCARRFARSFPRKTGRGGGHLRPAIILRLACSDGLRRALP